MDFSKIILTESELGMLETLSTGQIQQLNTPQRELLIHLKSFELVEYYKADQYGTIQKFNDCIFVKISDFGKRYLIYQKKIKNKNRTESIRYWITTSIAILALITAIVSIILQYL